MRATLSSTARATTSRRTRKGETINVNQLRAEDVIWMPPWVRQVARHGRQDRFGHSGQEGRPRAHQERPVARDDADPQPHGPRRVPGRHRRRHTVVVNGRVIKYEGTRIGLDLAPVRDAVAKSVEYVRSQLGEKDWEEGMHPPLTPTERIPNPYGYTDGDD